MKNNLLIIFVVTLPLIVVGLNDLCNDEPSLTENDLDYYTAAVVEYEADDPTGGLTQEQVLWKNVENYERIILDAARDKVDIIIFPEYGLTSLAFPRPLFQRIGGVGENPCLEPGVSSEAIQHISCAARAARTYVVIDVTEVVPTSDEPETINRDQYYYNTAVVFGRDGKIVAKYHKTHLFAEPGLDAPSVPEVISFRTDFDVEFGILICFDMLFQEPAQQLLQKGMRHFVYPTAWIDELPYLTAMQAQMYWSGSTQTTLLASGYHQPSSGKLGSGIFISGKPLNYTFNPSSSTKVVLAQVPKNSGVALLPPFTPQFPPPDPTAAQPHWYYREDLTNYTAIPLGLSSTTTTTTNEAQQQHVSICDNGFCCSLNYSYYSTSSQSQTIMTSSSNSSGSGNGANVGHKLIVFNQTRKFSSPSVVKTMHIQVCSIVRCINTDDKESCTELHAIGEAATAADDHNDSPYYYLNSLQLQGGPFSSYEHRQPGFSGLNTKLDIFPIDSFQQLASSSGGMFTVSWTGKESVESADRMLQTLAIFHRVF